MSEEPEFEQRLNLVERMAMGLVVNRTDAAPQYEDAFFTTGEVEHEGANQIIPLVIDNPHAPIEDVLLTIRARLSWASGSYAINVYVGGTEAEHWDQWVGGVKPDVTPVPCSEEVTLELPVLRARWIELLEAEVTQPVETFTVWVIVHVPYSLSCNGNAFVETTIKYRQQIQSPQASGKTWFVSPVTLHKTLVTSPPAEPGVPHYHRGEFVINRRTGKLLIATPSYGTGPTGGERQWTTSGAGVAPADADGNKIPTHGSPGTFESITTGRLQGRAVRLTSDGGGPSV